MINKLFATYFVLVVIFLFAINLSTGGYSSPFFIIAIPYFIIFYLPVALPAICLVAFFIRLGQHMRNPVLPHPLKLQSFRSFAIATFCITLFGWLLVFVFSAPKRTTFIKENNSIKRRVSFQPFAPQYIASGMAINSAQLINKNNPIAESTYDPCLQFGYYGSGWTAGYNITVFDSKSVQEVPTDMEDTYGCRYSLFSPSNLKNLKQIAKTSEGYDIMYLYDKNRDVYAGKTSYVVERDGVFIVLSKFNDSISQKEIIKVLNSMNEIPLTNLSHVLIEKNTGIYTQVTDFVFQNLGM